MDSLAAEGARLRLRGLHLAPSVALSLRRLADSEVEDGLAARHHMREEPAQHVHARVQMLREARLVERGPTRHRLFDAAVEGGRLVADHDADDAAAVHGEMGRAVAEPGIRERPVVREKAVPSLAVVEEMAISSGSTVQISSATRPASWSGRPRTISISGVAELLRSCPPR